MRNQKYKRFFINCHNHEGVCSIRFPGLDVFQDNYHHHVLCYTLTSAMRTRNAKKRFS